MDELFGSNVKPVKRVADMSYLGQNAEFQFFQFLVLGGVTLDLQVVLLVRWSGLECQGGTLAFSVLGFHFRVNLFLVTWWIVLFVKVEYSLGLIRWTDGVVKVMKIYFIQTAQSHTLWRSMGQTSVQLWTSISVHLLLFAQNLFIIRSF